MMNNFMFVCCKENCSALQLPRLGPIGHYTTFWVKSMNWWYLDTSHTVSCLLKDILATPLKFNSSPLKKWILGRLLSFPFGDMENTYFQGQTLKFLTSTCSCFVLSSLFEAWKRQSFNDAADHWREILLLLMSVAIKFPGAWHWDDTWIWKNWCFCC